MSDEQVTSKAVKEQRMMENLYWWGIPSFFRCPIAATPEGQEIVFVGVPHSTGNGTTERDQHLGPRAVRNLSANLRRVHMRYQFSPWQNRRIADVGDVPLPQANNNEACIRDITRFYQQLGAAGARPVSIGGDHSITGGILRGITDAQSRLTDGPVALLHFDAHTDAFDGLDHFLGAVDSAAHWAGYSVREGLVDARHSVQIGLRGNPRTLDWLRPSYELGYHVVTMEDYRDRGLPATCELIRSVVGDRPIYITFDLDCLDPTVAPAVANLEPGCQGFMMDEVIQLIQAVKGLNVIGGDVACLIPSKDSPNQITSMVAGSVAFEIMAQIAWYLQHSTADVQADGLEPQ